MKLSIFLAGIRPPLWKALYDSIPQSTSIEDYELIFVSPYELPPELQGNPRIRVVKDYGCPSRCYQLGLLASKGEYVVWAADDGTFTPNKAIDKAFDALKATGSESKKSLVSFKYFEGPRTKKSLKQECDEWWKFSGYRHLRKYIGTPNHYFMVMNALIRRDYFIELGGFDCNFEHLGIGSIDVAVRLQNDGAKILLGENFMNLSHSPGNTGDHAPINIAHSQNDWPLFQTMYSKNPQTNRTRIDINNWQQAPDVWTRRFNKKHLPQKF